MNGLMRHLYQSLQQLWRRLLSLLRRGRYEREMEEEMRFHLAMQIEQNIDAGIVTPRHRKETINKHIAYSGRREL